MLNRTASLGYVVIEMKSYYKWMQQTNTKEILGTTGREGQSIGNCARD